jgi:hypothetical protein
LPDSAATCRAEKENVRTVNGENIGLTKQILDDLEVTYSNSIFEFIFI